MVALRRSLEVPLADLRTVIVTCATWQAELVLDLESGHLALAFCSGCQTDIDPTLRALVAELARLHRQVLTTKAPIAFRLPAAD